MIGNFLAIEEHSSALTTVFEVVAVMETNGCRAAGDTAVRKLELVPGPAAASNQKRSLSNADGTSRRIRSNNLQDRFADGRTVRHEGSIRRDSSTRWRCAIFRARGVNNKRGGGRDSQQAID